MLNKYERCLITFKKQDPSETNGMNAFNEGIMMITWNTGLGWLHYVLLKQSVRIEMQYLRNFHALRQMFQFIIISFLFVLIFMFLAFRTLGENRLWKSGILTLPPKFELSHDSKKYHLITSILDTYRRPAAANHRASSSELGPTVPIVQYARTTVNRLKLNGLTYFNVLFYTLLFFSMMQHF